VISVGLINSLHLPVKSEAINMILMTSQIYLEGSVGQSVFVFMFLVFVFTVGSMIPAYQGSRLSPVKAMGQ
jgi:ABC-type lipoprotein release transport system permease subunit